MTKTQALQTIIFIALTFVGLVALASPANTSTMNDLLAVCGSDAEALNVVHERLAELGETNINAVVKPLPKGAAAQVSREEMAFSNILPCAYIRSAVDHEWAHVQQDRMYPGRAAKAFGSGAQVEILADCVAKVFGNPDYSPYLAERGYGCTQDEYATAQRIIDFGRVQNG